MAAQLYGALNKENVAVPTAIMTAAYTALAGDFVPVDVSSGSVTITLPAAPADQTRIGVKLVRASGSNTVTVACSGSDKFNADASTTATLRLLNQGIILQYAATPAVWYVQSDDLPLSGLDGRYAGTSGVALLTGAAFTGNVSTTGTLSGSESITAGVVTLTYGATITVNASLGGHFRVTLTGNATISNPTSPIDGQKITLEVIQDTTGGRLLTWGAAFDFGAAGAPGLTPTPSKRDLIGFVYSSSAGSWLYAGIMQGF